MLIDLIIIVGYFSLILGVGIWRSRSVKNVDDFMVGGKNYRAGMVFATLSAAFIGGGFTMGLAEKVFTMGLVYVIGLWGFSVKEILVAKLLAPRMNHFSEARSVGDIMGQLYGKPVKVFTGVASVLVSAGIAGAQFAAFGYVLNVLLGIEPMLGIIVGVMIVIIYSALGGMKSVVTNDAIHFCVLVVSLPLVCLIGLYHCGGFTKIAQAVPSTHLSFAGNLPYVAILGLFLNFFFGETLVPPYVQRLLIGKNAQETAKGTYWSALLSFPFFLIVGMIGLIALTLNPQLNPHLALPYMINTVMPVGLKGLAIAGMMAVLMSSGDSFLNAASVSLTHDVIKPLRRQEMSAKKELYLSRLATVVVGATGAIFALSAKSALDILLVAYNFWTPFILVPLVAGIMGMKVKTQAFWWGSLAGIAATCLWLIEIGETTFSGAIIGVAVNFVVFMAINFYEQKSIEKVIEAE